MRVRVGSSEASEHEGSVTVLPTRAETRPDGGSPASPLGSAPSRHTSAARAPTGRSRTRRGYGRTRQTEINLQAGAFQDWMNTTGRKKGLQLSTEAARGEALNAGDILDLHSGSHPKGHTGHVATVVNALQAPKIQIVSGNAAESRCG